MTAAACSRCGAELRPGAKFCTACGATVSAGAVTAAPVGTAALEPTPPELPRSLRGSEGTDEATPRPSVTALWQARDWGGLAKAILGGPGPLGMIGGVLATWFVTSLLSHQLWTTLRWPAEQIQERIGARDCASLQAGTWDMYLCSARVGFFRVLGPLVVVLMSILFRKPITAVVRRLRDRLPAGGGLVSPIVVAMLFTMAYSQIHRDTTTADLGPLIPQKTFPAAIAVLTYVALRSGPRLTSHLGWFFRRRDRLPIAVRMSLVVLLPILLSYFLTNEDRVTDPARKEQLVIMATMVISYLAVVPTSGNFTGTPRSWFHRTGRASPGNQATTSEETTP